VIGSLSCVRVAGGLLPADVVAGVLSGKVDGLSSGDFHLAGEAPREAAARVWAHLLGVYRRFRDDLVLQPHLWWHVVGGVVGSFCAGLVASSPG